MDVGVYPYSHGDPILIDKIVNEFLSQGKFDKLRKECMSDADTKPAYQNLQQRVENTVTQFLKKQVWRPDLNKNQLRDSLRKHILESKFFDAGINRIVDQVVNPNVLASVFLPEVEEVVYNYLSIPRPSDKVEKRGERIKSPARENEYKTSQVNDRFEKYEKDKREGYGDHRKENHLEDEDFKPQDFVEKIYHKDIEISNESLKTEPVDEKEKTEDKGKLKLEKDTEIQVSTPVEKMEIPSDESQESLRGMAVEGLRINEFEALPIPDSDDSIPLEINEKSMSESRDSEDSILNQMSPISQGRLTPDLDEKLADEKTEEKQEKRLVEKEEEKGPLTFIGRIPKIKREDSDSSKSSKAKEDVQKKEKLHLKNVYSSDESDSSKSYGKSDSDEKRRKNEKLNREERRREDSEKKQKDKKREVSRERKKEKSRDRHKDHKRDRSRERHKKSSSSSSSSQREKNYGHHKSSHRDQDSKIRRKEEEKKKSKSTDDHGRERNKKEDRRSTDRDSNERERGRSSGSRTEGDSRRREKEQSKSEENNKEKTNQKEEMEMEKEDEVAPELQEIQVEAAPQGEIILGEVEKELNLKYDADLIVLDLNELFQSGALSKLEFPKVTDDFYVKFNSTGFRYFEEWEKVKLDCEEEFKEFVDEAENDLSLLSDDESDFEFEFNFEEENQKTIKNALKGLGNFRRSLMFDPDTSEFYKWTNNKFYQKFRKKEEGGEWRSTEKNESDESIKENIDRGERKRALHLKLLNKYRRKAMRMGRPRRRHRRPVSWGIKEKNENQNASGKEFLNKINESETFLSSRVTKLPDCNAVNSQNADDVNSLSDMYRNEAVTLPDSPEENEEWSNAQKVNKKEKTDSNVMNTKLSQSLPLNLPPSPDSDDINTNSGIRPKNVTVSHKRINKERKEGETPRKQIRRNHSQKYDSQDLYKPRPVLNGSSSRQRKRGLECDVISLDSPISRQFSE